ncbi:hypothetical protein G9464_02350 [Halostella sp. JP-L12]|uniref:hypothetical protein n=1 Tax=Halostella TaxID=1843185 RepID=UPI000EF7DE18|nr:MULTISPECIES: hypothetical protein [Halostella]NHN46443.1 hypothetical protein [Halostella sp. JP-L12]
MTEPTPSSTNAGPARILRVKFTEEPSLEDYRVTVQHPNGKRVDVADKDLGIDGRVIEVRNLHRYAALYGDGALPDGITVSVTPTDDASE